MDEWQPRCEWDLAETCSSSLTVQEVLDFAGTDLSGLPKRRLVYGDIRGSDKLRGNIASLYDASSGISPEHVLVTQGAIGANFLVLLSLISAGSHVVVAHPTYQQLTDTPRAFGADVTLWKQTPDKSWKHNVDELIPLLKPETSLVIINNPKNPTGTHLDETELEEVVTAVQRHASPECIILSDEVYSPLYHSLPEGSSPPPSILTVAARLGFKNAIATGSLSKAFALAGLRVGWIATPRPDLVTLFADVRNYNVISVSGLDDYIAAIALEPATRQKILKRNTELALLNRVKLQPFMDATGLEWVPTTSGTTALIKLPEGTDDVEFCRKLAREEKVLLCPGTYFEWSGWVRMGYVNESKEFEEGLEKLERFVKAMH
ncbi:hypothetical protein A4X09_0g2204 [Tilletia walkeri]|uniref:Aminotransferase class I/classII large domain-containing protein n=1 Tax=Tilletia walkeri TaxID=117179 RepID=A0A8X7NCU1_9BASI|nr:hypothetical protein A4X09_0g2204 [Tilletia walkeri]